MVQGFESFKNWFAGYEDQYAIIGGTACDLVLTESYQEFRATKDIDLVLIVEALTPEFGHRFWNYIKQAGYEHKNKSTGQPQFYRFSKPATADFPYMIELFSRKMDAISLPPEAILTPVPLDDNISSLSAILLDDNYYEFLKNGKCILSGVTVLDVPYIIPFKMKAWLDLTKRKTNGEPVDSKNIRKHKNDVLRLSNLITLETKIEAPESVYQDIEQFIKSMHYEDINLRSLGIRGQKAEILQRILNAYHKRVPDESSPVSRTLEK